MPRCYRIREQQMPSHHPKKSVTNHILKKKITNVKGSANDLPWWIPTPILVLIKIPMIILQRGRYCHNSSRNIPWCSDWLTNPHSIPIAAPCFSWLSHHVTPFFAHLPRSAQDTGSVRTSMVMFCRCTRSCAASASSSATQKLRSRRTTKSKFKMS